MGRGWVQASEAVDGGEGYSSPSDAGGWQSHSTRTVLMLGWQWWRRQEWVCFREPLGSKGGLLSSKPIPDWTRWQETTESWTKFFTLLSTKWGTRLNTFVGYSGPQTTLHHSLSLILLNGPRNTSRMSSKVTFIYIALLTIQIVTNQYVTTSGQRQTVSWS